MSTQEINTNSVEQITKAVKLFMVWADGQPTKRLYPQARPEFKRPSRFEYTFDFKPMTVQQSIEYDNGTDRSTFTLGSLDESVIVQLPLLCTSMAEKFVQGNIRWKSDDGIDQFLSTRIINDKLAAAFYSAFLLEEVVTVVIEGPRHDSFMPSTNPILTIE